MKRNLFLSILCGFFFLSIGTGAFAQENAINTFSGGSIKSEVISIDYSGLTVASTTNRPYTFPMSSLQLVGEANSLVPGDHVHIVGLGQTQGNGPVNGNINAQENPRDFRVIKINHPYENVVISH